MANISKALDPFLPMQKDSEGLILVTEENEQTFVVDCPALHIVSASTLGVGPLPYGTPVCVARMRALTKICF